jgi:hypothetical protein
MINGTDEIKQLQVNDFKRYLEGVNKVSNK